MTKNINEILTSIEKKREEMITYFSPNKAVHNQGNSPKYMNMQVT